MNPGGRLDQRQAGDGAGGLIIAAPASGSGKTLITQSLLRLLKNSGYKVTSAKTGPDYIDPHFHALASGRDCLNLDSWAMRPGLLAHLLERISERSELTICEGVMGLFDGAAIDDGFADGSTASLARLTGWPVLLIVDAAKQAASVAALVRGFVSHAPDVHIAGVIFNRVGSAAHAAILSSACARHVPEVPVLGALPRQADLHLPERHLGLVQAGEQQDIEEFLETAAAWLSRHINLSELVALARPARKIDTPDHTPQIAPLGARIAVAQDTAFAFSYPSLLQSWHDAGAEIQLFSPLAGDSPDADATAVYLPGGYPELHAAQLAKGGFLPGLRKAAERKAAIFGECGGFMVLGQGLIDGQGSRHQMAGLLPVETSFEAPALHLGYRQITLQTDCAIGRQGQRFRGHEFHYASTGPDTAGQHLFRIANAGGADMGETGCVAGSVAGSFVHLIDRVDD